MTAKKIPEGARVKYVGRKTKVLEPGDEGEVVNSNPDYCYVKLDRDSSLMPIVPAFSLEKIADPEPLPFGFNPLRQW